ncbi:MAG: hypothetical protein HC913_07395 [Microscillaceae bacterium]|nr:hypothetical protein [Microscillaceae bacterium]
MGLFYLIRWLIGAEKAAIQISQNCSKLMSGAGSGLEPPPQAASNVASLFWAKQHSFFKGALKMSFEVKASPQSSSPELFL